ncbi:MAG: hypothetical protein M0R18_03745 [Deltaproteobacteria bacterium]|nr:hypothetical protein [Deltaproteobacteria bacterium]
MLKQHGIGSAMVIVACSLVFMGMSGLGTVTPQNGAASSFNARIMDTVNNEVEITAVTIDGKPLFQASLGKGKVRIPFENISRITIKDKSACVTLKGSKDMRDLKVNQLSRVYGNTPFGTYQISLKDVAWIEFSSAKK